MHLIMYDGLRGSVNMITAIIQWRPLLWYLFTVGEGAKVKIIAITIMINHKYINKSWDISIKIHNYPRDNVYIQEMY